MPTLDENLNTWNDRYGWPEDGEEWSLPWGNSEMHWRGTLLPRIGRYLPAGRVVELAPGRGRWTRFLLSQADSLHLVDQSPECIEHCRKRFGERAGLTYATNDGRTLTGVADHSVDFLFCYDSLVHAEIDVIRDYLKEFRRVLSEGGVAFVHHSNLHEYVSYFGPRSHLPRYTKLAHLGLVDNRHWRAMSVSAERVREAARQEGVHVVSQEITVWCGSKRMIDCMSVFSRVDGRVTPPTQVVRNQHFQGEIDSCGAIAAVYAPRGR